MTKLLLFLLVMTFGVFVQSTVGFGGPLIIIDLGTATTFCAVTAKAEYLGGTIAPGLKISSDALFEKTAKLPRVELEEPGQVICKNTNASMQSGLVYGHMGMVDFIVRKMKEELKEYEGSDAEPTVIATGGLASLIDNGIDCIDYVDKLLTLEGLEVLYRKNKNRRKPMTSEDIRKQEATYEEKALKNR